MDENTYTHVNVTRTTITNHDIPMNLARIQSHAYSTEHTNTSTRATLTLALYVLDTHSVMDLFSFFQFGLFFSRFVQLYVLSFGCTDTHTHASNTISEFA